MSWGGTGVSVMEMSHRSKDYMGIVDEATSELRKLIGIPEEYEVFFFQGGASL